MKIRLYDVFDENETVVIWDGVKDFNESYGTVDFEDGDRYTFNPNDTGVEILKK